MGDRASFEYLLVYQYSDFWSFFEFLITLNSNSVFEYEGKIKFIAVTCIRLALQVTVTWLVNFLVVDPFLRVYGVAQVFVYTCDFTVRFCSFMCIILVSGLSFRTRVRFS